MAINVGARLIAWNSDNVVERVEEAGRVVAENVGVDVKIGQKIEEGDKVKVAEKLADVLFEALTREDYSTLASSLVISGPLEMKDELDEIGFSGGVAEYVYDYDTQDYGDMGPLLGAAVRSRLPKLGVPLAGSSERIRATVIGASQYTVQVSSSTVFVSNSELLPHLDLQVVPGYLPEDPNNLTRESVEQALAESFERLDIAHQEIAKPIRTADAITETIRPLYKAPIIF